MSESGNENFDLTSRQELIVWLYSTKKVKQLKKHGFLYYVSRKMKYAILYTSADQAEASQDRISKLRFVRSVEVSPRQRLSMDFDQVLPYLESKMNQETSKSE